MTNPSPPPQTDSLDEFFRVLVDSERRTILAHLSEAQSETASLDELANVLASDSATSQERARIRLHHTHLPKLDATAVIDYDVRTTTVRYHGHRHLEAILDSIENVNPALTSHTPTEG